MDKRYTRYKQTTCLPQQKNANTDIVSWWLIYSIGIENLFNFFRYLVFNYKSICGSIKGNCFIYQIITIKYDSLIAKNLVFLSNIAKYSRTQVFPFTKYSFTVK